MTLLRTLAPALALLVACGDAPASFEAPPRARPSSGEIDAQEDTPNAPPAPPPGQRARRDGVVFLHGTGDQGVTSDLACRGAADDWSCAVRSAVDEYWLPATIDAERARADGSRRPFAVLGCPLGSQTPWPNPTPVRGDGPEPGSAACAAAQIARFLDGPDGARGTEDDLDSIAIVTHSGGSNVIRYLLQQHTASAEFARVHAATRGFIAIAAPSKGTYLADWVFRRGSLANLTNAVVRLFGGAGFFDDDGTAFIRTSAMELFNRDPAKLVDLGKDVAGVPAFMGSGTFPDASGDEIKVTCGGEAETKGLSLLHALYLDTTDLDTHRDGCSDGFISCRSAMALAEGDPSRVLFGRLDDGRVIGETRFRAHHQTRRQCAGVDSDVRRAVQAVLDGAGGPPQAWSGPRQAFAPALQRVPGAVFATSPGARANALAISAAPLAHAGEAVEIEVALGPGATGSPTGFLEDPSRRARVPLAFRRGEGGRLVADATLPRDAADGAWSARVVAGDSEGEVVLWVNRPVARIASARAARDANGVTLEVDVVSEVAARLGVRATLVTTGGAAELVVGTAQASADVDGRARFSLHLDHAATAGPLEVRDVVLVRHDDASTQALVRAVALP